jgi:hypothetical protein
MESAATRIAVAIQGAAANVDLEVLSLPGGSVFAVILWLCATVVTGVGRARRYKPGAFRSAMLRTNLSRVGPQNHSRS